MFTGAVPLAEEADPDQTVMGLYEAITAELGASPGMDFHGGVRRVYDYGPTTVTGSTFSALAEGVVAIVWTSAFSVTGNTFTDVYDHGVYVLGTVEGGVVDDNAFVRLGSFGVKVGGHTEAAVPESSTAGFIGGSVSGNTFAFLRTGAVVFAGVGATLADNVISAYAPADDPSGWYDPEHLPDNVYPDFWMTTESGQGGWAGHVADNTFLGNRMTEGELALFFEQRPGVADRSISGNRVSGASQHVWFHHLVPCATHPTPCSSFTPSVTVEDDATLTVGAPDECGDCYPDAAYYIDAL